jgi:hypothetical protein
MAEVREIAAERDREMVELEAKAAEKAAKQAAKQAAADAAAADALTGDGLKEEVFASEH